MGRRRYPRLLIVLVTLLILVTGCGTDQSSEQSAAYRHLEPEEAAALIESGDCILIDVRSSEEFKSEHIPGAVNIPYDSDDEVFTSELPDKDAAILLYCDYGGISKDTAEHLTKDLGYKDVSEFDGLLVWSGETVSE